MTRGNLLHFHAFDPSLHLQFTHFSPILFSGQIGIETNTLRLIELELRRFRASS